MTTRRTFLAALAATPIAASQLRPLKDAPRICAALVDSRSRDELITDAFIRCGLVAPGETLSINQLEYGVRVLSRVIDAWDMSMPQSAIAIVATLAAELAPTYGCL